eukprot:2632723-Pyramimonas_sp.AAC.1
MSDLSEGFSNLPRRTTARTCRMDCDDLLPPGIHTLRREFLWNVCSISGTGIAQLTTTGTGGKEMPGSHQILAVAPTLVSILCVMPGGHIGSGCPRQGMPIHFSDRTQLSSWQVPCVPAPAVAPIVLHSLGSLSALYPCTSTSLAPRPTDRPTDRPTEEEEEEEEEKGQEREAGQH